jgi:hypothetical protein
MKHFNPKQIMGIKNMAIIPMSVRIFSVDRCSPSLGPSCSDRITAIVGKLYWNREDRVQHQTTTVTSQQKYRSSHICDFSMITFKMLICNF